MGVLTEINSPFSERGRVNAWKAPESVKICLFYFYLWGMRNYFKNLWWAIKGYPTERLLQEIWYGKPLSECDFSGSGSSTTIEL